MDFGRLGPYAPSTYLLLNLYIDRNVSILKVILRKSEKIFQAVFGRKKFDFFPKSPYVFSPRRRYNSQRAGGKSEKQDAFGQALRSRSTDGLGAMAAQSVQTHVARWKGFRRSNEKEI